jgi:hypothetical protein
VYYIVLSVIGYEIEMRGIPVKFEKEINSIIWDFIWDGKTNQISRNVCSLPQNKGGMGMVNLNHFIYFEIFLNPISLISEHLQRKKSVSNFESIDVSQYLPITFHLSNSECIILCNLETYAVYHRIKVEWEW